jgi:alanyl-tRNA synthetase
MPTRLYYTDAYRTDFTANVVSCEPAGTGYAVVLDDTAFYPTSGGQPYDTGTLNGMAVTDVVDQEDGTIAHMTERPLVVGAPVEGWIDWGRRFDHMQQHTGQHILSAAFDRLHQARTESFHLGAEHATIDLSRVVAPAEIAAAEDEANRIVWEDRPVHVRFVTPEEAAALPLRKDPARSGPLRLIDVEDYDLSACGGTHVARTGGIGIIAVSAWEKFRAGTRVEFRCGRRALERFRYWRDALAASQRLLSVAPHEMPAALARAQADSKAAGRQMRQLQEQLAAHEATALVARGTPAAAGTVVVEAIDGWDAAGLKALASAATTTPNVVVALFGTTTPAVVVVARSAGVPVDAAGVVTSLVGTFGGRGGGKPDLAQAGGLNGATADLVHAAKALLGVSP